MIAGIGVDLVEIEEFNKIIFINNKTWEKIYNEEERSANVQKMASIFAIKEAFIKAMAGKKIPLLDIVVKTTLNGPPRIIYPKNGMPESLISTSVTLSHTQRFVIAIVIRY